MLVPLFQDSENCCWITTQCTLLCICHAAVGQLGNPTSMYLSTTIFL
eukprot:09579.XXX_558595_558735_1 [CDS] Oithona nana genome sequencing.